jgi:uncharacterized protein YecE (DUF72 family)
VRDTAFLVLVPLLSMSTPPPADDLPPLDERRARADAFGFRAVHPHLRVGTASDRYGGWIGQIYPERYESEVTTRTRRLGGEAFEEAKLPVASVRDYFEHFGVLEIDFTFYRPLLDADGEPTNNRFALGQYAEEAPEHAAFLVKAPQTFFAPTLRRTVEGKTRYVDNSDYLDAEAYMRQFHEPVLDVLGERLAGVVFEQAYRRVGDSPSPEANVEALDAFFDALPSGEAQAHLELRSEHLLEPVYFDWLNARGLGFVFSHWTWLPPIREQWRRCGERFPAADGQVVARLLTPRDMKYAEAYAKAHPFEAPVPALAETKQAKMMVDDAAALVYQAEAKGALLNLIANNRAWGNAPDLARTIAHRVMDEEERRALGA